MDLNQLANLGEFIGGVAVIASLVFVGFQIHQSNRISRAESVRNFIRDYNNLLYKMREDGDVVRKGLVDFNGLSKSDQTKLHVLFASNFFMGWGDSMVDPGRTDRFASFIDSTLGMVAATPGMNQWWSQFRMVFQELGGDYIHHIDRIAQDPEAIDFRTAMHWWIDDDRDSGQA